MKQSLPAGDQSTFITKLLFLLEQRFGRVVDVLCNDDSKFDITIEIKHSRTKTITPLFPRANRRRVPFG
jgi:hypothetical protein